MDTVQFVIYLVVLVVLVLLPLGGTLVGAIISFNKRMTHVEDKVGEVGRGRVRCER